MEIENAPGAVDVEEVGVECNELNRQQPRVDDDDYHLRHAMCPSE